MTMRTLLSKENRTGSRRQRRQWITYLAASSLVLAASAVRAATEFRNADLQGSYGFSFELNLGGGAPNIVAVGQFVADGAGNYSGERTVNFGAASPTSTGLFHQAFTCTYSVVQSGTGTAICATPFGPERFGFVLVDEGKELQFISITPGISLRGVARKQSS